MFMSKKVQYANQTVVCYKEDLAEVLVDFYRIGPVLNPMTGEDGGSEAKVVSRVAMTKASAENLMRALTKALKIKEPDNG